MRSLSKRLSVVGSAGVPAMVAVMLCAGIILISSCGPEADQPAAPTDGANRSLDVRELTLDDAAKTIEGGVVLREERFSIKVSSANSAGLDFGVRATLSRDDGGDEVLLEWAWDADGRRRWFRQVEGDRGLTLDMQVLEGTVVESYAVGGQRFDAVYPVLDESVQESIAERVARGFDMIRAPQDYQDYAQALIALEGFLSANAVGQRPEDTVSAAALMAVLSSPEFAESLQARAEPADRIEGATGRACWLAGTCASLMCRLGGFANPLCVPCGGVAAACIVAEVSCWFLDCDCCF